MKYKGTLVVVKDCHKALQFYREMFGFTLLQDNDGNMELSDGLYLQEVQYWEAFTGRSVCPKNNCTELYFEEPDLEGFLQKLQRLYPEIEYVNPPMRHSWGQRVVRFYDPDGNLIEVGTPISADQQGMEGKDTMLETDRLKLYPATREQMESFIAAQKVDVLKAAYAEMLDGCLKHPNEWEWYAIWMIELWDGTHIGDLCFKGITEEGNTEIGYGIEEDHQGRGYATEAVSALVDWAFEQPGVTCVTAETEESNIASHNVLKKAGFIPTGKFGEEGPLFARRKGKRQQTN